MTEPTMVKAKGDGVDIQLAVWEGDGENILCIHGLSANCRCWDRIVSGLEPEFRVLAMDLRGRGLSDKPPTGYSIDQHAKDVLAVLKDQGLTTITLMGHSLGAYVSLAFAAHYPTLVNKLILVDGGGSLPDVQWDKIEQAIKPSIDRLGQVFPSYEDYTAPLKLAPFLKPWTGFLETYFRYEIDEIDGGVRSRTPAGPIREEVANIRRLDASLMYPKIACPVLLLRATEGMLSNEDMVLPADRANRMVREIAHAKSVDLPGTNHYSILFGENEVRDRTILAFLGAISPSVSLP
ncbi:hydrolase, alpha/beta domain protein [delta proteobacterium NaphS2]|nr:hydrolase, alpha/beta domain protein [delta proteobacterium NaphS2]